MPEVHSSMTAVNDTVTTVLSVDSVLNRADIWHALVMPDQLRHWLGHVNAPLTAGTEYVLAYLNGSDHRTVGEVLVSDAPSTLEFTWRFNGGEETLVRIELAESDTGTLFTLTHSGVASAEVAANAATWHAQIEFLGRWLHDRISLGAALRERRNELVGQYEAELENAMQHAGV